MLVPVARIGKLFGSEGGLTLTLYPAFPADFSVGVPLFVRIDALDVPLWCARIERRGVTSALVHFDDIDTARRASELVGRELCIELADNRSDDEFYMEDLIGFHAFCTEVEPDVPNGTARSTEDGKNMQTDTGSVATDDPHPTSVPCTDAVDTSRTNVPSPSSPHADRTVLCGVPDHAGPHTPEESTNTSATPRTLEGEVTDYYDSDANPLLEVTAADGTEVLIPAVEEFIAHIDFQEHRIDFVLPKGLIELQR